MPSITLYTFSKRSNSLKQPTGGITLDVKLKQPTSIYTPSFILVSYDETKNYLKWGDRYYYIVDIIYRSAAMIEVKCSIDLLATYRANILATTSYVEYSTSNYDPGIIDTRLTTVDEPTFGYDAEVLITDGSYSTQDTGGTYILGYVTNHPTFGATGLLWFSETACESIGAKLTDSGFLSYLSTATKEFQGVYESITSLKHVPMEWYFTQSAAADDLYLGGWDSGLNGNVVKKEVTYSVNVNIPWQFSDFRNRAPFTSIFVFLPAYGFIELNADDLIGKSYLNVKLLIDGVTGEGTYIIDNLFRGTANFANDASIGTLKNSVGGLISAGVSIIGGAVAGGGLGAAYAVPTAITGIISSMQRSLGSVGGSAGGANVKASFMPDWRQVTIITLSHDTVEAPSDLAATNGRPLKKVVALSGLTGYCQTNNISVATPNSDISEQINEIMNGGVFIE